MYTNVYPVPPTVGGLQRVVILGLGNRVRDVRRLVMSKTVLRMLRIWKFPRVTFIMRLQDLAVTLQARLLEEHRKEKNLKFQLTQVAEEKFHEDEELLSKGLQ